MNVIFYCCNEKNIFYSICVKKIKKIARVVFDLWKKWRHRRSATLIRGRCRFAKIKKFFVCPPKMVIWVILSGNVLFLVCIVQNPSWTWTFQILVLPAQKIDRLSSPIFFYFVICSIKIVILGLIRFFGTLNLIDMILYLSSN